MLELRNEDARVKELSDEAAVKTIEQALLAIESGTDVTARQAVLWDHLAEVHSRSGDTAAATEARGRATTLRAAPTR